MPDGGLTLFGTVSYPLLAPDGSAAAPSYAYASAASTGFYYAAPSIRASIGGTAAFQIGGSGVQLPSTNHISWNSGAIGVGAADAFIHRLAAASLIIGNAANATPVANTLQIGESSRAGTDANVAGSNGTITSGNGTGTGAASSLLFQTPTLVGAGSGAQTLTTRLTIATANITATVGVIAPSYSVLSAGNTLQSITSTAHSMASGIALTWSSSTTSLAPVDTAIGRNAAGVVEINNGTPGTFRDLKCQTVVMTSTGAMTLPVGTNAQQPAAAAGLFRYNSTNSQVEFATGSAWFALVAAVSGGKQFLGVQALTGASGTYTPTAGTTAILIYGVGAGGGGGGATINGAGVGSTGGGGGSGAFAVVWLSSLGADTAFAYVNATGGTGGAAGNNNGNAGSATATFTGNNTTLVVTCPPGQGGTSQGANAGARNSQGGAGGTIATTTLGTGIILSAGEPGFCGNSTTSGFNPGGGHGAGTFFGAGGLSTLSAAGGNGSGKGAGGAGGGSAANDGSGKAGGNGTDSVWIVFEYA